MVPRRPSILLMFAILAPVVMAGCERVMHNLHPDRLWRLNRGPAVGVVDSTFSVPDTEATARAAEWREIVRDRLQSSSVDP